MREARPNRPGTLLLAAQRAQIQLGGCALLVAPPWFALPLQFGPTGVVRQALPIPLVPALVGGELDLQAVIADPQGGLLNRFSATQGLAILIGQ